MSANENQGGIVPTISAVDGLLRTLLATVVVGGLGYAGYVGYSSYNSGDIAKRELVEKEKELQEKLELIKQKDKDLLQKDQQIATQLTTIKAKEEEIAKQLVEIKRLDKAMRLLKMSHRLARLSVLDQKTDPATMEVTTKIQFVELDDANKAIGDPKVFDLKGDMVYVDFWIVKFEDKYIESADLERGTSICLFRRIFGEHQKPSDGYLLEQAGSLPKAFGRGGTASDFERQIWDDFWQIANDRKKAAELGISAAHGDATSTKLMPGKQYRLDIRSTGAISIKPDEAVPPVPAGGNPG